MGIIDGTLLDEGGAYVNVRSQAFGATGNGTTPDDAAIQAAIDYAQANGRKVYIPAGTYLLNNPLVLTRTPYAGNLNHFAIQGEFATTVYMGQAAGGGASPVPPYGVGTILKAAPGIDAIQTPPPVPPVPPPTEPTTPSDFWTNFIDLRDLYVIGAGAPGVAPEPGTGTVGFNLSGVFFGQFHNLHAEGFGTGLRLQDGSECWFTGLTWMENNYYGAYLQRSAPDSDLQAWFENLVTDNNQIGLAMDYVRSVWIEKGENIPGTLAAPQSNIVILNSSTQTVTQGQINTQIKIRNYTMETRLPAGTGTTPVPPPAITVDAYGLSLLSIDGLNWETVPPNIPSLIQCAGWFERIEVRNSALPRALLDPPPAFVPLPLVQLSAAGADNSAMQRSMQVVLEGNSPAVADTWVYDATGGSGATPYRDPLHDFVPTGFVQVNPCPQMDQAGDNRITAAVPYAFTNADPLAGNARLYWDNVTPQNTATLTLPRAVSGVWTIYVTMIAYVPPGSTSGTLDPDWIPSVQELAGIGTQGTNWVQQWIQLEQYSVGGETFTKFAATVTVTQPQGALTSITVGPFYGGSNVYGLETLNVYLNADQAGALDAGPRMCAAMPSGTAYGAGTVGDLAYSTAPASGQPVGWVCTAAGIPGTWNGFGVLS